MSAPVSRLGSLSVIIASFNSAEWLPSTIDSLCSALTKAGRSAEIVVVNDGSTDDSGAVLEEIRQRVPYDLVVIDQENQGRFLARWSGISAARHDDVLILDSRLLVHPDSIAYLDRAIEDPASPRTWNGHVATDASAPLVGQFWSVPTYVFWGYYLANPRPINITAENFDRVPKGTGFLFVQRSLFKRACLDAWPEKNADLTSDDTKLLRYIADEGPIRLDPGFSATYRPRGTVRQFFSHSFTRGTLFVDSYAGTSALRNAVLVTLSILPWAGVLALVVLVASRHFAVAAGITAIVLIGIAIPAIIALLRRCPPRSALSYAVYVVPFGFFFAAGLGRGIVLHRKSFLRKSRQDIHR
ncbi:MAG TPA: glycosyltransferase family 2 protein [Pseudolysinimonas sp.]|nr:glycosyltransferase family 2 protein [Pseudolysinimonas sp.]